MKKTLFTRLLRTLWSLLLLVPGLSTAEESSPPDGVVLSVTDGVAIAQLREGLSTGDGSIAFIYRVYTKVPDQLRQSSLSGETWIGRTMLQQVENGQAHMNVTLYDVQPGDVIRVAEPLVASTVANDAWVPRGGDRFYLTEPFLVPRQQNNRIAVTSDFARMGKAQDYYAGLTVDFTYWPMLFGSSLESVEYIRFGVGGFMGQMPLVTDETSITDVRFIFGFAETDFRLLKYMGLRPSVKLGLNNSGFGAGGGLAVRVGTPQNSHLVMGFEMTRGVGGAAYFEAHHFFSRTTQGWVKSGIENLPTGERNAGKVQLGIERQLNKTLSLQAAIGLGGRKSTEEKQRGVNGMVGFSYNFSTDKR